MPAKAGIQVSRGLNITEPSFLSAEESIGRRYITDIDLERLDRAVGCARRCCLSCGWWLKPNDPTTQKKLSTVAGELLCAS